MHHSSKSSKGFTLIEMMIVITIIAILISLALPTYQSYTVRAKVGEGLGLAAAAKMAVGETCTQDTSIIPSPASVGYPADVSSTYVSSIEITNTCAEPWITIYTRNTGASPDVVISLDGSFNPGSPRITWNCHQVAGERHHLPSSCRGDHL